MKIEVLIPIIISSFSLLVSLLTAYKTLFARFSGRLWLGNYVVLNHINDIPAVTLYVLLENAGAKLGILDDLRIVVEHQESGASYKFFPIVMRDDYSVFKTYSGEDWINFGGILLSPGSRVQKHVVFRAMSDNFSAQHGHFNISVQYRWYKKSRWKSFPSTIPFDLTESNAAEWNNGVSLQIASDNIEAYR